MELEQSETEDTPLACAQRLIDVVPHVMQGLRESARNQDFVKLSIQEYRVAIAIDHHPSATATVVNEHLGLSKATLSKILVRLVERGLVNRATDEQDRRSQPLTLTEQGRQVLAEAEQATVRMVANRISHLTPEQLQAVILAMNLLALPFGVE